MFMKIKPSIKKLRTKAKKLQKRVSKLWNKSRKFRFSTVILGTLFLGMIIGAITTPSYDTEFEVVPSPSSQGRVTHTDTPGVIGSETSTGGADINPENLLDLSNQERKKIKRTQLKLNSNLASSAQAKCEDMADKDYWDHNSPDGLTPWYFIDNSGYIYGIAGENLAYGFSTAGGVIYGWMGSPSHKKICLTKNSQKLGLESVIVKIIKVDQT